MESAVSPVHPILIQQLKWGSLTNNYPQKTAYLAPCLQAPAKTQL